MLYFGSNKCMLGEQKKNITNLIIQNFWLVVYVRGFWETKRWTFSLEEVLLWIMESYFDQKQWFEVKNILMMDLFLTNTELFTSQVIKWCVDYCGVFISCLDSHSDGTHSLQRIHCWATDAMLHFSKSDEEKNLSQIVWVNVLPIFIFG